MPADPVGERGGDEEVARAGGPHQTRGEDDLGAVDRVLLPDRCAHEAGEGGPQGRAGADLGVATPERERQPGGPAGVALVTDRGAPDEHQDAPLVAHLDREEPAAVALLQGEDVLDDRAQALSRHADEEGHDRTELAGARPLEHVAGEEARGQRIGHGRDDDRRRRRRRRRAGHDRPVDDEPAGLRPELGRHGPGRGGAPKEEALPAPVGRPEDLPFGLPGADPDLGRDRERPVGRLPFADRHHGRGDRLRRGETAGAGRVAREERHHGVAGEGGHEPAAAVDRLDDRDARRLHDLGQHLGAVGAVAGERVGHRREAREIDVDGRRRDAPAVLARGHALEQEPGDELPRRAHPGWNGTSSTPRAYPQSESTS